MPVEFYEEDNLSAVMPRASMNANRPRSALVRLAMKLGFKTERGANIFLLAFVVCGLIFVGLAYWGMFRANRGAPVSWDQIPQEIRDQLPPNIVDQLKQ